MKRKKNRPNQSQPLKQNLNQPLLRKPLQPKKLIKTTLLPPSELLMLLTITPLPLELLIKHLKSKPERNRAKKVKNDYNHLNIIT